MRKIFIFFAIIMIMGFMWPTEATSEQEDTLQVIPDDAIRLRILANSDNDEDQQIKELVRDEVSEQIAEWVDHMTDIDEARNVIESRIPELRRLVANVLKEENKEQSFEMEYNSNVTFPAKLYDSVVYPPGEYEAVLITIGEGEGSNWWCVLFPPLCFLDFDHGATVADADEDEQDDDQQDEEKDDGIEIKFFLFDWLGWT